MKPTVPIGATGNVEESVTVARQKIAWLIITEPCVHVMLVLVSMKATSSEKLPRLAE